MSTVIDMNPRSSKRTPQSVCGGDYSRVAPKINVHGFNPAIPPVKPEFAEFFGLPPDANYGQFDWFLTEKNGQHILDKYNETNHKLIRDRTEGVRNSMIDGSFIEAWRDPFTFDWFHQLMSGQKRTVARVEVGPDLHEKYGGGVWVRIVYGADPATRPMQDTGQERKADDTIKILPSTKANNQLIAVLKFAYFLYTRKSTATLVSNPSAYKRILGAAKEAFFWVAHLNVPGHSNLSTAPVHCAFVEMYVQNPTKAKESAQALYFPAASSEEFVFIQPINSLRAALEYSVRNKRAPLCLAGGGTQGIETYRVVVPFLDAVIQGKDFTWKAPHLRKSEVVKPGKWTAQELIVTKFINAINSEKVPNIEFIADQTKIVDDTGCESSRAAKRLQKKGLISAKSCLAAVKLMSSKNAVQAAPLIEKDISTWNAVVRKSTIMYRSQGDKSPCQPATLCAFLWTNKDAIDEAESFFLDKHNRGKIVTEITDAIQAKKRVRPIDIFYYLCAVFEAYMKGKRFPRLYEANLDDRE